jgi:hypothetical protein
MIAEEIKRKAGNKYRSTNWWTNQLMNELSSYQRKNINEFDTNFIVPGDLVFFMYSAKYPQKYDWWDRYPLSYIIEVNPREGYFIGANLHYLNPQYRGGVAKSLINKSGSSNAPKKTLHKYLFSGVVTEMFKVPKTEWVGVSLLPTEKFVDKKGQNVPKYRVWDAP